MADSLEFGSAVWAELWISLASLLRSYTAAHGLHSNRQAKFEIDEKHIIASHGNEWLELEREGPTIRWSRADGSRGVLELTEAGRLRGAGLNDMGEEEMDMAAEAWARDLMREPLQ